MGELVFPDTESAERALTDAGFSFGSLQRDDPRGIMFGDYDIQKWRNLRREDKSSLDGVMTRLARGPDAPVKITLAAELGEAFAELHTTLSNLKAGVQS